jgi:hypothetical protein
VKISTFLTKHHTRRFIITKRSTSVWIYFMTSACYVIHITLKCSCPELFVCEASVTITSLKSRHRSLAYLNSFIRSSMALRPFVGPWPLLQLRNLFYTDGRTPWTSDQPVARPLPTLRATQTQNKRTHRHPCLDWDSNPRSQLFSERRHFMP